MLRSLNVAKPNGFPVENSFTALEDVIANIKLALDLDPDPADDPE